MAYAAAADEGGLFGGLHSAVAPANPASRFDRFTAVYDISARVVYLPDGTRLEAHSGLREHLDDPRYVHLRMRGPTPPHVYDLTPREKLFLGVEALRLNPVGGENAIYGRAGLLAHTFMLGPNGDSNGCVSFRNYGAFLQAYKRGLFADSPSSRIFRTHSPAFLWPMGVESPFPAQNPPDSSPSKAAMLFQSVAAAFLRAFNFVDRSK